MTQVFRFKVWGNTDAEVSRLAHARADKYFGGGDYRLTIDAAAEHFVTGDIAYIEAECEARPA